MALPLGCQSKDFNGAIFTDLEHFTMVNNNYRNKKRRTKSKFKRLGYHDQVIINDQLIYLKDASRDYPKELFRLVVAKSIWVADRVYMNLLDVIKVLDPEAYKAHRTHYHTAYVQQTKAKWHGDVNSAVSSVFKNKFLTKLELTVTKKETKTRTYRLVTSSLFKNSTPLSAKVLLDKNKEESTFIF
jgi:hypothetical protein